MKRWFAIKLIATSPLPMPSGMAEFVPEYVPFTVLALDRVLFYQERTHKWLMAFGNYLLWEYNTRATFSEIYGRIPGDYINDKSIHDMIPKFSPSDCLTYDEAQGIARVSYANMNLGSQKNTKIISI